MIYVERDVVEQYGDSDVKILAFCQANLPYEDETHVKKQPAMFIIDLPLLFKYKDY